MSTTTAPRTATAGLVGGALWALLPIASNAADVNDVEFGTLPFVAVMATYWAFAVLGPALIVAGLVALRRSLGTDAGRVGALGLVLAMVGTAAMSLGVGIEAASISLGGGEVPLGHAMLLIGFLVSIVGGIVVGIVLARRRREGLYRAAGLLLAFALPLGIGLGFLGSSLDPDNDAWFWAAISVPTGIAWVLLGTALRSVRRAPTAEFATAS
ncbi:hypothetical protein E4P40_17860 [Blastococcus sp. CT_GayMR20]|uniref:hypothetical protein n=1 Tax=Blastococcus sp. CT_GayMR20 TaxID=2559609 RepID=UPI0010744E8A|nr:hypothetical protein [Blastococcus sp. CT_GayMR20]TFV80196.1 hypothetical protein E4P40_17860 [Blastococcus sp. CT_GayMR20]